jgi:hypothetical protein
MMNNRMAREQLAKKDADINTLVETGFDERQAELALEANDRDVDAALDDLLSGKRFAEPKEAPKETKRDIHQDIFDDQDALEKRLRYPAHRASSVGISMKTSRQPPRLKVDETKKQSSKRCRRPSSSFGLESSLSPSRRNDESIAKDTATPQCPAGGMSTSDTNNIKLRDQTQVGAVAVAGPDLEAGDYDSAFDASEAVRLQQQTQQPIQEEPIFSAELAPLPEAVMVQPPENGGHDSKDASTQYWTRNRILFAAIFVLLLVGATTMGAVLALNKQSNQADASSNKSGGTESTQDPTQHPIDDVIEDPVPTEGPVDVPTEGPVAVPTNGTGTIIDPDESTQLVKPSGSAKESFGEHVVVSRDGSTIASGAPKGNYVEVFRRNGARWDRIGQRLEGDANGDQFGRCVDLNADGSMLIVGAWNNDDSGIDSGHVRVFRLVGDQWEKVGTTLKADASLDRFGWYVTMSDDGHTIAVSAREADVGDKTDAGYVRVFTLDGNDEWSQLGPDIEGETQREQFGRSITMSSNGQRLAIGTTEWDQLTGIVRVFDYSSGNWNQVGQDLVGDNGGDFFGSGVSLSKDGSMLAIGADGYNNRSGVVRVYRFNGSYWSQYGNDVLADGELDALGMHQVGLSADGCCLIAGASHRNNDMGTGYIYAYENDGWNRIVEVNGYQQNDRFGESVSISDDCKVSVFGASENDYRTGYFKVYTSDQEISC